MKSISTINPAIMENVKRSIVEMCTQYINLKVGVSLDHGISLYFFCFQLIKHFVQHSKQRITWEVPLPAITQVSHWSHNAHTANHHLRGSGERNEVQRRTKASFCRTMIQTLELLWSAKRHVLGRSHIKQYKNQAHSLSSYRVRLVWRHQ